jgi:hypothetical protein
VVPPLLPPVPPPLPEPPPVLPPPGGVTGVVVPVPLPVPDDELVLSSTYLEQAVSKLIDTKIKYVVNCFIIFLNAFICGLFYYLFVYSVYAKAVLAILFITKV